MGSSTSKPTAAPSDTERLPPQNEREESKCPMSRGDGTYSYDWRAFLKLGAHPKVSKETLEASKQTAEASGDERSENQSGCPVKHNRSEYNVYGRKINPDNNMPSNPNQLPNSLQIELLSTEREQSTIPKGGTSGNKTWTYPSPQMFYNALSRKGKLNDTAAQDVKHVVNVHNAMNEQTWHKILQWERLAGDENVKLLKFQGRPHDLSPKAALKHYLFGHPLPFDRHDWLVERPDGSLVRYVLDYYYDETGDRTLLVDVRPAADCFSNVYQRIRMHFKMDTDFDSLPLLPSDTLKTQVNESIQVWEQIQRPSSSDVMNEQPVLSEAEKLQLEKQMKEATKHCKAAKSALENCKNDGACQKASLDWILCNGKYICQIQHQALTKQLTLEDGDVDNALERLHDCVNLKINSKLYSDALNGKRQL